MNIDCIGAGPSGLYFAILTKINSPSSRVRIFERDDLNYFPGWGVVLDEDIRDHLAQADPISATLIFDQLYYWDTLDVKYKKCFISSKGYRFACISRKKLTGILRQRALKLGVEFYFNQPITNADSLDSDLVIVADGGGSTNRNTYQHIFKPKVGFGKNYYIWYGTKRLFSNFTFDIQKKNAGWIWMQSYQYCKDHSTFIAECDPAAYAHFGFSDMSPIDTTNFLDDIYGHLLNDHKLELLASENQHLWRRFQHIHCEQWHNGHMVLIGDAAHTAHYSVGSGTKLALLDAITLAKYVFGSEGSLSERLNQYQMERKQHVEAIQRIANNSNNWFEHLEDFSSLSSQQFGTALLTRTQFTGQAIEPSILDSLLNSNILALAKKGGATSSSIGKQSLSALNLTVSTYD